MAETKAGARSVSPARSRKKKARRLTALEKAKARIGELETQLAQQKKINVDLFDGALADRERHQRELKAKEIAADAARDAEKKCAAIAGQLVSRVSEIGRVASRDGNEYLRMHCSEVCSRFTQELEAATAIGVAEAARTGPDTAGAGHREAANADSALVLAFLKECTVSGAEGSVPCDALFEAFTQWRRKRNEAPEWPWNRFERQMKEFGFRVGFTRQLYATSMVRTWTGLRLKSDAAVTAKLAS